jgi:membrane protein implicated in regulation of membrane protease activity
MRMLAISLGLLILILPSMVASFLILTALPAIVSPLYFALVWSGVAFSAVALLCGQSPAPTSQSVRHRSTTNSLKEKNDEASITT